jgi:hypothetical protein
LSLRPAPLVTADQPDTADACWLQAGALTRQRCRPRGRHHRSEDRDPTALHAHPLMRSSTRHCAILTSSPGWASTCPSCGGRSTGSGSCTRAWRPPSWLARPPISVATCSDRRHRRSHLAWWPTCCMRSVCTVDRCRGGGVRAGLSGGDAAPVQAGAGCLRGGAAREGPKPAATRRRGTTERRRRGGGQGEQPPPPDSGAIGAGVGLDLGGGLAKADQVDAESAPGPHTACARGLWFLAVDLWGQGPGRVGRGRDPSPCSLGSRPCHRCVV